MNVEISGLEPVNPVGLTDRFNLTEAGEKLLEVIINPESRTLPVTQICQKAGISRDSWYRLWKDERFIQAFNELCQTMLLSGVAPASHALIVQAAMGDTAAIKMILEMAGFYKPAATVNINHQVDAGPSLRELLDTRSKTNNGKVE